MRVWTYWECPYCKGIVRGDNRECPKCGSPIPNDVSYMMPDNPRVIDAIKNGEILIKSETNVDSKGVISEVVKPEEYREGPNWLCPNCGRQNFATEDSCKGCGAPRSDKTYFDAPNNQHLRPPKRHKKSPIETTDVVEKDSIATDDIESKTDDYKDVTRTSKESKVEEPVAVSEKFNDTISSIRKSVSSVINNIDTDIVMMLLKVGAVAAVLFFLVWFFTPITRSSSVTGFTWSRDIEVQEYTLCHESDWSVPSGATVTSQKKEIHHYDRVIDHYETKSKKISHQEIDHYETKTRSHQEVDGYETKYEDLGNGQAEAVRGDPIYKTVTEEYQDPVYKTVWETKTWEEPVYRNDPVYKTKYYYDIGRWKYSNTFHTEGNNQDAVWYNTNIPEDVSNPDYGDKRLGARTEKYQITLLDANEEQQYKTLSYNEWIEYVLGDKIEYKTFRFSQKPL